MASYGSIHGSGLRNPWYRLSAKLTNAKIKAAKPRAKAYKLADSGQLYLLVSPAGGRHWRMNCAFGKNADGRAKQKTLSLGSYPSMTLSEARARRDEAKAQVRDGLDPSMQRRIALRAVRAEGENTFEKLARKWHEQRKSTWSKVHAQDVLHSLERDVFSCHLSSSPILPELTER